ncbi:scoloptoxin SSD976-like [Amblyomma americanum]
MDALEATAGPFVAVVATILISLDKATAVCRPEYQNLPDGITHTACKPPNPRCVIDTPISGLSAAVKAQALQVHNDYRSQIAMGRLGRYPQAKDMYELEWDDELAEVAQAFADQCDDSGHDDRRARITTQFKSVGQNLAYATDYTKQTVVEGKTWVDDWFSEYRDFNPNAVSHFDIGGSRGVVTHFTQIAWANTRYIGCGFSNYVLGGRIKRLFVCNYAPAGNILRRPMYMPGPACTQCPQGSSCVSATGLCRASGARPPPGTGGPGDPPGGGNGGSGGGSGGNAGGGGSGGGTGTGGGRRSDAEDDGGGVGGAILWITAALFAAFLFGACVGATVVSRCTGRGGVAGSGGDGAAGATQSTAMSGTAAF